MNHFLRPFALAVLLMALIIGVLAQWPAGPRPSLGPRAGLPITAAKSWGYQLQGARAELIPQQIDLLVIDMARDASERQMFTPADIADFRRRPGAPDRIVLAYMSVGEAETYRAYWRPSWTSPTWGPLLRPAWLGRENKEWKGNYLVRYWQPGWQRLIVTPRRSQLEALRQTVLGADLPYIDAILEAGFDGVYMDRVDAFGPWEKDFPGAQAAMRALVADISAYAKARRPGFLIVPQNGEELTRDASYVKVIDGIAKEELVFGLEGGERENPPDEISHAADMLTAVARTGRPVFVVEYVSDLDKQQTALRQLTARRFVPTFTVRDLNVPPAVPPALMPPRAAQPALTRPLNGPASDRPAAAPPQR
jgi:cysteinyl-tRNA synthetase, unknown class